MLVLKSIIFFISGKYVPDVGVDHKTWCCTKIQTDNVIPGEDFGSMNPIEIKEWKYRKCCSPQKSWGCCKSNNLCSLSNHLLH